MENTILGMPLEFGNLGQIQYLQEWQDKFSYIEVDYFYQDEGYWDGYYFECVHPNCSQEFNFNGNDLNKEEYEFCCEACNTIYEKIDEESFKVKHLGRKR